MHGLNDSERKKAHGADITYGTNEFGFDYLRDKMKFDMTPSQRPLHYAIVDEVDSILIDEARTPIISGLAKKSTHLYYAVNGIIPRLKSERDYVIDEKARTVTLTGHEGVARTEEALQVDNLFDPKNMEIP